MASMVTPSVTAKVPVAGTVPPPLPTLIRAFRVLSKSNAPLPTKPDTRVAPLPAIPWASPAKSRARSPLPSNDQ